MTPRAIRTMFARVARKSAAGDTWASGSRDFELRVDGVACKLRWKLQLYASAVGESRQITGECIVQVLTADGERCELAPSWIHFTAREDALINPAPLFEVALRDATSRLLRTAEFQANAEREAIALAVTVACARVSAVSSPRL